MVYGMVDGISIVDGLDLFKAAPLGPMWTLETFETERLRARSAE